MSCHTTLYLCMWHCRHGCCCCCCWVGALVSSLQAGPGCSEVASSKASNASSAAAGLVQSTPTAAVIWLLSTPTADAVWLRLSTPSCFLHSPVVFPSELPVDRTAAEAAAAVAAPDSVDADAFWRAPVLLPGRASPVAVSGWPAAAGAILAVSPDCCAGALLVLLLLHGGVWSAATTGRSSCRNCFTCIIQGTAHQSRRGCGVMSGTQVGSQASPTWCRPAR